MTATNHTEHYDLSQYAKDDHPTYTGDYNSDMSKIDAAIYAASQSGGGGMATVAHTADLTGDGSADNPLGVADTIARTEDIPGLDGYATTESVTQAIAAAIADRLKAGDIKAGNGINIETSGNQVTISYVDDGGSGGLAAVAHDATLTGDGTSGDPLAQVVSTTPTKARVYEAEDAIEGESGFFLSRRSRNLPYDAYAGGVLWGNDDTEHYGVLVDYVGRADLMHVYGMVIDSGQFKYRELAMKADIPDVSALTSRIDALETQVAALTAAAVPSATGLTAEQLDSQYADGYNIVRVGTPTQLNESEVNPNE